MNKFEHHQDLALKSWTGEAVDWEAAPPEPADKLVSNLRLIDSISRTLQQQSDIRAETRLVEHLEKTWSAATGGDPDTALTAPQQWGNLEVRGVLGSGASADVFRAWDPALKREVALKLYRSDDPGLQSRMLSEGQRLARVNHENVVSIFGAEQHGGRTGLWMELLEGITLDQLRPAELASAQEASLIGISLCRALAAIHQAGLIHGDIKAQNVVRCDDGRIVLTDFGSGREQRNTANPSSISGTPLYLAPEVLAGSAPSAQSDLYSLGVLLFHISTGRFPYEADNLDELKQKQALSDRAELLALRPELSAEFAASLNRSLAPNPANRFLDAGAFASSLAHQPKGDDKTEPGRPRQWLAVGLLIAVAASAFLLNQLTPIQQTDPLPGYQLNTQWLRVSAGNQRNQISSGAEIVVGDGLSLAITADRELHVYVFNEDSRQQAYGLFPLGGVTQANPLAAGQTHYLPGGTRQAPLLWEVDSVGGVERIHLLVSPEPLGDMETLFSTLPAAQLKGGPLMSRGVGSVRSSTLAQPISVAPLTQLAQSLGGSEQSIQGVYYTIFEFHHGQP